MIDQPPRGGAVGRWAEVQVWGITRLAHVEERYDVDEHGDRIILYVATIYKGNPETGEGLSAEYWRGISDKSIDRAFAAASELIAREGPPELAERPTL